ncbi:unnamed protein product [Schistosoma margrebowiei]|uniref:Uncharacterized protein n=1 Tax=Schistosoma margrebowiei TaxID=48269 RepID=A0A183MN30_9TREM|nr:unnamed protein product [Schistosoma margrebowiei]
MVVGGNQQETLNSGFVLLGTRQQGVPVILRELVLPGGFDHMSPSFTVRAPVPSRLQVHLTDECQVARNPSPGSPVDYLQPPSRRVRGCARLRSPTIGQNSHPVIPGFPWWSSFN